MDTGETIEREDNTLTRATRTASGLFHTAQETKPTTLSANALFSTLRLKQVKVPEHGGVVYLLYLPAGELLEYVARTQAKHGLDKDKSRNAVEAQRRDNEEQNQLLLRCVCNEHGERLFSSVNEVERLPAPVYNFLTQEISAMIKFEEEEGEE